MIHQFYNTTDKLEKELTESPKEDYRNLATVVICSLLGTQPIISF